eukprot:gene1212-19848_t
MATVRWGRGAKPRLLPTSDEWNDKARRRKHSLDHDHGDAADAATNPNVRDQWDIDASAKARMLAAQLGHDQPHHIRPMQVNDMQAAAPWNQENARSPRAPHAGTIKRSPNPSVEPAASQEGKEDDPPAGNAEEDWTGVRSAAEMHRCAPASHDCSHLVGCMTCKLGSAVFDPADTTNCLTCVKNYTFIDHGYTDCTGHCKKQLPEEVARRAALSMGTGALLSQASNADTNNEALQDSIRTKPAARRPMAGKDGRGTRTSNDLNLLLDHAPFDIADRDIIVEPNALVADCVTVSEASRHYCDTVNMKAFIPKCADSGTDCSHILGCATCKA